MKKGLWANIHAKRKRGEKMRKKGAKGANSLKELVNFKCISKIKVFCIYIPNSKF